MRPGFPMQTTATKIGRGHYRIDRADGYSIVVRSSGFGEYWYDVNGLARQPTLRAFIYDMRMGFTARDRFRDS